MEQFCYDALNRLTAYSVNGASCRAGLGLLKTVAYDDIGNIVSKSDVGTYSYPPPGHALPHAVKTIAGTVNGTPNPGFRYDDDGNLTCEFSGTNCAGGAITRETDAWWSFNMAHTISDGTIAASLTYDSEHARIAQTLSLGSTSTTTIYLNDPASGNMSERVATGGAITWNDYLTVDGRLIAERSCAAPCTAAAWSYFVTDHLGSVAVVTDQTGAVTTNGRLSFDAWGRQRNANGSDDPTCSNGLSSPTTRGFTGQEEIAALCLVNLNARIYDPTIGRFLSPDSIIPDPYDAQSYNRYSYVNNRPLSFTDPTGHDSNVPWCIGICGSYNPGSQAEGTNADAHPEMEVLGSFTISESGNLGEGITRVTITYNSDGESRLGPDKTAGEVSTGTAKAENNSNASSNTDPKNANQTMSAQYTNDTQGGQDDVAQRVISGTEYNRELANAHVSGNYSVDSDTEAQVRSLASQDGPASDNLHTKLDQQQATTVTSEHSQVRVYIDSNGKVTSESVEGTPFTGGRVGVHDFPPLRTDAGRVLVNIHAHIDDVDKAKPSSTDLITSAQNHTPGAFTYPLSGGKWGMTVYQGHRCGVGACP